MLNILFFNLICLMFLRNKYILPMLLVSFFLDIYSFNFIGFHALLVLLLTDFFKGSTKYLYCLFISILINFIICYASDLQTILFYGYSNIKFHTITVIYLLVCSTIFTNILQKNI